MPRDLGKFPVAVAQVLLRLPRNQVWQILDALQRLCDDPHLLALLEEDGQSYILVAGYAVFVDVNDASVSVVALRRFGST